ncbi:imidazole glycerol phosphate synthase subunit HisH [Rhizobacter sp. AJA081-3]|uniref:imidazole glycerol phosphate synthase subunit HisH n=1 Tax=Rhizobacter sp. AJA081-3 TaxID=2753607 RepID=UPI001ADF78A9|nr:imidazole glycerol phosphate synthase subunit HisH [Rhizobacter sp. AJA081-3]QTN24253.1 imidazole glycerol phosphate synthase subunit HisH [Rhizobacter sp. AJA081-3]
MISIVDYGLGNIRAFSNMYGRLNIEARAVTHADELRGATKIILPGVGAFDHAMQLLQQSGMRETLDDLVLRQHVPVMGICVGMQILAEGSDEGQLPGLGWVPGRVRAFNSNSLTQGLPLPHMGWNDVKPKSGLKLFDGLEVDARFYFLHSYYFDCACPDSVAATASYGIDFSCAVHSGNVFGVQFHPEKSHHFGAQLLKNFAEL